MHQPNKYTNIFSLLKYLAILPVTELYKFAMALKNNCSAVRWASALVRSASLYKKEYVVINLEQLNIAYCEKFIEPAPEIRSRLYLFLW